MKKDLFRVLSLAVILAFLMPAMTNAQTGKVNFSGKWVLNEAKSDMGQPPQGGGGQSKGGQSPQTRPPSHQKDRERRQKDNQEDVHDRLGGAGERHGDE